MRSLAFLHDQDYFCHLLPFSLAHVHEVHDQTLILLCYCYVGVLEKALHHQNLLTMLVNFVAVGFDDGLQVLLHAFDCCNRYHPLTQEIVMEVVLNCRGENIHHMHLMNIRNEVRWFGWGLHHGPQRQIKSRGRIKNVGR